MKHKKHLFTLGSLAEYEDPIDLLTIALPRKLQEEIIEQLNIYINGYNDAIIVTNHKKEKEACVPDISMCTNADCPLKDNCYRFTAKPSDHQYYRTFVYQQNPINHKYECEGFMQTREKL